MRGDAVQTFKNINSHNRENLGDFLTVFRMRNVKPQSMATAKHKFQRLVFHPANQKLRDFLGKFQKLEKDTFGVVAQAIRQSLSNSYMPKSLSPPEEIEKSGPFGEGNL